jgi:GntR family transcriptional regulator
MFADGVPVQLATSYLPLDLVEGTAVTEEDTGLGGTYSRLADLGYEPVRFREMTRVRTPDDAEARALDLDSDHRVFDITRVARTAAGRIVEVTTMTLAAHHWTLDMTWSSGE